MTTITRGMRNKNLGNIDWNARNPWNGQIGIEPKVGSITPRFAVFDSYENGIRALAILLLNYRGKDGMPGVGKPGIDTPLEFISRWAPGNENNTAAYVAAISKRLGVGPKDSINMADPRTLRETVIGIIIHENGYMPVSLAIVDEGIRRALNR